MMVSALQENGLDEAWTEVEALTEWRRAEGFWQHARAAQARYWFEQAVKQALLAQLEKPKAKAAFDTYSGEWFTRVLGEGLDKQQDEAKAKIEADSEHTVYSWTDAQIEEARALLQPVVDEWNKPNDSGVNLYEEANAALEAVRAGN